MVEFALTVGAVVFLIFWFFETVMVVYTFSVITNAAKEGVRYAIVHGASNTVPSGPGNLTDIKNVVEAYARLSLHDTTALTVTPAYPDGTNRAPNRVSVTITYTYVPYIKLPWTNPSISAKAQGRIVN